MITLSHLNEMEFEDAHLQLLTCCGSDAWATQMAGLRPFKDETALFAAADQVWAGLTEADYLEAFEAHPRIGDLESLKTKFKSTAALAGSEQGAVAEAPDAVLRELKDLNDTYFEKFGFIFIICATGKSASEMLSALKTRVVNSRAVEVRTAAAEQAKITRIRLEKIA